MLDEPIIQTHGLSTEWSEEEIAALSKVYCTSREAIVRRLQILGLTTHQFYEMKRKQYLHEFKARSERKGFVSPSVDLVSTAGKFYVRTIMDAFRSDLITPSDAIDYLGIRLKHLDRVTDLLESYGAEG